MSTVVLCFRSIRQARNVKTALMMMNRPRNHMLPPRGMLRSSSRPDSLSRYVSGGYRKPVLEVLTGVGDGVDRPARLGALLAGDERADEDDPLALLAGDPGPVVGVGRVREVLVLLELVHARLQQVLHPDALLVLVEEVLDRHLLGPVDDVLDHRAGVEVLEVQDLLVAVGVGDLEETVLLGLGVHALHGG